LRSRAVVDDSSTRPGRNRRRSGNSCPRPRGRVRKERRVSAPLRIVIADDERPARSFLAALLRAFDDVTIVGEADSGRQAVSLIVREKPDLALLDLHMPELGGLGVVRALKKHEVPLIAFVTAYEEYAVRAFQLNAVDYLLKPVDKARLRDTLNRAHERIERTEDNVGEIRRAGAAATAYEAAVKPEPLDRIPIRKRDELTFLPAEQVASVIAEGELLHLHTLMQGRQTITFRLKDLEARLDPSRFVRLGRGTLANLGAIVKVNVMPGGTHVALMSNGQKLQISRIQSRKLRSRLFKL